MRRDAQEEFIKGERSSRQTDQFSRPPTLTFTPTASLITIMHASRMCLASVGPPRLPHSPLQAPKR